jgi:hypothetical protein
MGEIAAAMLAATADESFISCIAPLLCLPDIEKVTVSIAPIPPEANAIFHVQTLIKQTPRQKSAGGSQPLDSK